MNFNLQIIKHDSIQQTRFAYEQHLTLLTEHYSLLLPYQSIIRDIINYIATHQSFPRADPKHIMAGLVYVLGIFALADIVSKDVSLEERHNMTVMLKQQLSLRQKDIAIHFNCYQSTVCRSLKQLLSSNQLISLITKASKISIIQLL